MFLKLFFIVLCACSLSFWLGVLIGDLRAKARMKEQDIIPPVPPTQQRRTRPGSWY
jgi:hypothetical protein